MSLRQNAALCFGKFIRFIDAKLCSAENRVTIGPAIIAWFGCVEAQLMVDCIEQFGQFGECHLGRDATCMMWRSGSVNVHSKSEESLGAVHIGG